MEIRLIIAYSLILLMVIALAGLGYGIRRKQKASKARATGRRAPDQR